MFYNTPMLETGVYATYSFTSLSTAAARMLNMQALAALLTDATLR